MITLTIAQLKILQGKSEVRMFTLRLVSTVFYWVQMGLRREETWVFQRVAAAVNQRRSARSVISEVFTILSKTVNSSLSSLFCFILVEKS